MRVLFLSHNRSDSDDAYNYRLRSLSNVLETEGIESSVSYLGDPPLGRPTFLHPLKISRVPGIDEARIVHAGSAAVAFSCAFLRKQSGRKIVFDMHGDTVAEAKLAARGGFGPAKRLRVLQERVKEKIGLGASDRVIVVSDPLRDRVARLGLPPERIGVFRNGVDLDRFTDAGPPPERPEPLVVYAGRFEAWQGVESLKVLASRAGRGFRLRVIGFSERDRPLRENLASLSSGKAELVGRLSQEELATHLSDADLLLIPRESHGATEVAMPTKFGEYLALGRPVLLTRVGEPAALVERERCGLVTGTGAGEILEGIRRFAGLSADERNAMGTRARRLAERMFDWKKIGAAYAAFLGDLAREGGEK